jgi:peptidoglycan hydrolase CwlO-like protein/predicted RNA-binding Zn-ribbon protein involved in translation (DUF1610 family)
MLINLKSVSNALSIGAGVVCLLGIGASFKTEGTGRNLALTVAVSSAALGIGNRAFTGLYEDSANFQARNLIEPLEEKANKLTRQNSELNTSVKSLSEKLDLTRRELELSTLDRESLNFQLNLITGKLADIEKDYQAKNRVLDEQLATEDTRVQDFLDTFKTQLINDCAVRVDEIYSYLQSAVSARIENDNYLKIRDKLVEFLNILNSNYTKHSNHLFQLAELDTQEIELFVGETIGTYTNISSEMASLKVRFRNLLNVDERLQLDDAYMLLADFKDSAIPKTAAQSLLREQSEATKNRLSKLDEIALDAQNGLDEMRSQVFDLIGEIDNKNLKILELENELKVLQAPQQWRLATGSNELTKGNMIIQYFHKSTGLILDRAFTSGDVYESKIFFHTDRNQRTLTFKELNEHSESLQQLCLTQKPISFDWDADKGLMVASLVWQLKAKEKEDELSDEAIARIARDWNTWKKHAKKWNRIRITGGSGAGKSPLTERIVSEQLRFKKVKGLDAIKLFNPQAGSRKDDWSFPSVGKTHNDSINGVAKLTGLCSKKHQGDFAVWIFDEVDSTLRQAPGKKRPTADEPEPEPTMSANMLSVITQIDHTSQAVFYLGQGANTSKIPNSTKGDWNNLVAIHINGNAQDYLRLAEHIDKDTISKLISQAELLQKYCSRKNEQLGLERVDPGAYRYALIDEYGEKQYFVLLPLFSADEFLDSLSTNTQNQLIFNNLDAYNEETENTIVEVNIKCPHCGSHNLVKNGKNAKGQQIYNCKDCDTKPKNFLANSN